MLSIIIPTLNEEEHIERVLLDLRPQMKKEDEILISDSRSTDRTVEIAKKHGAQVLFPEEMGKGMACTVAARASKNPVLVFLDADSQVPEGYLDKIREHFSDPELLVIGGLDLYSSESYAWKWTYDTYSRFIFLLAKANHLLTRECWVPSNNSAFRKDVFLDVGGYRSVICEDSDLMKRFPKTRKIIYDNDLRVTLSDRRFRQNGFFRTIALWSWSNLNLFIGNKVDSGNYKKGY